MSDKKTPKKAFSIAGLGAITQKAGAINNTRKVITEAQDQPAEQELSIDVICPCRYQPRRFFDMEKLQELANSIKEHGVLQPIVVRPIQDGGLNIQYEIIAGERRWRATELAGINAIPVVIRDVDDQTAAAISLIENIERENLKPSEVIQGYAVLRNEFKLNQTEIAQAVGKKIPVISNALKVTKLAPELLELAETKGNIIDITALAHLTRIYEHSPDMAKQVLDDFIAGKLKGGARSVFHQHAQSVEAGAKAGSTQEEVEKEIAQKTKAVETRTSAIDKALNIQGTKIRPGKNRTTVTLTFEDMDAIDTFIQQLD